MSKEKKRPLIEVETEVNAPVAKVWECWTDPKHIINWNQASEDWHCPAAENDLKANGKFKITMAAKDGSMSFDFEGTYTLVKNEKLINYVIADGRKVEVTFATFGELTIVTEIFEAEETNSVEMQMDGWQSILDSFKKYTEGLV